MEWFEPLIIIAAISFVLVVFYTNIRAKVKRMKKHGNYVCSCGCCSSKGCSNCHK